MILLADLLDMYIDFYEFRMGSCNRVISYMFSRIYGEPTAAGIQT